VRWLQVAKKALKIKKRIGTGLDRGWRHPNPKTKKGAWSSEKNETDHHKKEGGMQFKKISWGNESLQERKGGMVAAMQIRESN